MAASFVDVAVPVGMTLVAYDLHVGFPEIEVWVRSTGLYMVKEEGTVLSANFAATFGSFLDFILPFLNEVSVNQGLCDLLVSHRLSPQHGAHLLA